MNRTIKSHWAFEIDPRWELFGEMVETAARAVAFGKPAAFARAGRDVADRSKFHP